MGVGKTETAGDQAGADWGAYGLTFFNSFSICEILKAIRERQNIVEDQQT